MAKRVLRNILIGLFACLLLTGCARGPNPMDPYQSFNEKMFAFNQGVDKVVLKPIAEVYHTITPPFLQKGITNVMANLDELQTLPNDLLQGKFKWALVDFWRFFINTTLGIGGLFDVASHMGLPKHYEDFGMTLAYWGGGKPSAYLVLPLLGPGTFRQNFGRGFDYIMSPFTYIKPRSIAYAKKAISIVNLRARLLPADKFIAQSFNPYVFVRNAYLQKRNQLIKENEKPFPNPGITPIEDINGEIPADKIKQKKTPHPEKPAAHSPKVVA